MTPHCSATFSAVSPIEYGWCISASCGLMKRQPSVVSKTSRVPRVEGGLGLDHHVRRARHALDAAGDEGVAVAGHDRVGGAS